MNWLGREYEIEVVDVVCLWNNLGFEEKSFQIKRTLMESSKCNLKDWTYLGDTQEELWFLKKKHWNISYKLLQYYIWRKPWICNRDFKVERQEFRRVLFVSLPTPSLDKYSEWILAKYFSQSAWYSIFFRCYEWNP